MHAFDRQRDRRTDGRTNRQTDRILIAIDRVCIACSAVKIESVSAIVQARSVAVSLTQSRQ